MPAQPHVIRTLIHPLICAAGLLLAGAGQAGEIYGQVGLPGVGLGYAHPVSPAFTVRGDFVTLGTHRRTTSDSGIDYTGELKANRVGLYADWFPFSGTFRFTGGVTANRFKLTLDAQGNGGTIQIGNGSYQTSNGDGLNVVVQFPKTTPYLGIGWGHGAGSGLRFSADIGASIGKASVTATPRGNVSQADADAELVELRDGVGKVRVLPQISFSLGYSF